MAAEEGLGGGGGWDRGAWICAEEGVSAGSIRRSARSLGPCDGHGEGGARGRSGAGLTTDDRMGTLIQRAILDHPRTDDEGG